ncbi:MAG: twin-arginine translocase subunit TatC, partial [Alphaproteobacteria bacterium]|nr:twin-arginine translocase subunit TatC [Alphaproteobacteria bacterium]
MTSSDSIQMSLVAHLLELRRRLIYSLVAFVIASLLCYQFAKDIYAFL